VSFSETVAEVEFLRVPYDIESTAARIRAAGLPEDFVAFLQAGATPAASALGAMTS
jgi:hypothetical protein